jgi:hypothetical protein
MKHSKLAICGILLLSALCGCRRERQTSVEIADKNGPEFRLRGSGTLAYFAVFSPSYPTEAREPNDLSQAIWLVVPKKNRKPVEEIGAIRYGIIPDGYTQEKPAAGTPQPLEGGKKYYFHVDTRDAVGASGYVEIRGGRALAVEGEHVCFASEHGKWIRKPCDAATTRSTITH